MIILTIFLLLLAVGLTAGWQDCESFSILIFGKSFAVPHYEVGMRFTHHHVDDHCVDSLVVALFFVGVEVQFHKHVHPVEEN
jgi:hypothetical protein